jgi:hypothetical protein
MLKSSADSTSRTKSAYESARSSSGSRSGGVSVGKRGEGTAGNALVAIEKQSHCPLSCMLSLRAKLQTREKALSHRTDEQRKPTSFYHFARKLLLQLCNLRRCVEVESEDICIQRKTSARPESNERKKGRKRQRTRPQLSVQRLVLLMRRMGRVHIERLSGLKLSVQHHVPPLRAGFRDFEGETDVDAGEAGDLTCRAGVVVSEREGEEEGGEDVPTIP